MERSQALVENKGDVSFLLKNWGQLVSPQIDLFFKKYYFKSRVKTIEENLKRRQRKKFAPKMLPKDNRLKKEREFKEVFKEGEGFKEGFLFLKLKKNKLKKIRFGFIVSRKISKKAVVRNRVKGRLREIVRERLPKIRPGIDGVLITRPGIEKKSFAETEESLVQLFRKAKILND